MACRGLVGDYLCPQWVSRTAKIRGRDGNRCRGCNRSADEIRLEVHHRVYGKPGPCGECYLTAVTDEDLTTLCIDCHEGITNVRRRIRYGAKVIEAETITAPALTKQAIRIRSEVTVEIVAPPSECGVVVRRAFVDISGRDT